MLSLSDRTQCWAKIQKSAFSSKGYKTLKMDEKICYLENVKVRVLKNI